MIELFCGLGGASKGALAEGYRCVGFDIERHRYPARAIDRTDVKCPGADWNRGDSFNGTNEKRLREAPLTGGWMEYPGELVLQDVLTIHGKQFRDAAYIWASPPCQEYSYMAMPWKRGKQIAAALRGEGEFPEGYTGSRTVEELTALFRACFRIQREACEAAGRHIPMVVENVKGAQPWVGPAQAAFGSFFLWGDIAMANGNIVLPHRLKPGAFLRTPRTGRKNGNLGGGSWFAIGSPGQTNVGQNPDGRKVPNMNFHEYEKTGKPGRSFQSAAVEAMREVDVRGVKGGGDWFASGADCSLQRRAGSGSHARKAASAMIAEIPYDLSNWLARCFWPADQERVA